VTKSGLDSRPAKRSDEVQLAMESLREDIVVLLDLQKHCDAQAHRLVVLNQQRQRECNSLCSCTDICRTRRTAEAKRVNSCVDVFTLFLRSACSTNSQDAE
jgi:hypothetical protein